MQGPGGLGIRSAVWGLAWAPGRCTPLAPVVLTVCGQGVAAGELQQDAPG